MWIVLGARYTPMSLVFQNIVFNGRNRRKTVRAKTGQFSLLSTSKCGAFLITLQGHRDASQKNLTVHLNTLVFPESSSSFSFCFSIFAIFCSPQKYTVLAALHQVSQLQAENKETLTHVVVLQNFQLFYHTI